MMYFFAPVLVRELEGLTPHLLAKSPDRVGEPNLPQARFSYRSLAKSFHLELPSELVLPTPVNWKNGREGDALAPFQFGLSYAFFADLYDSTIRNPTPKGLAARAYAEAEAWPDLIGLAFDGKSADYERYETYKTMQNTLATLAAGVTLLLTRQTGRAGESGGAGSAGDILHLTDAVVREIRHQQRYDHLKQIAKRAHISFGWAIAIYCLIYERKGGAAVRMAASKDPEAFLHALDALVWGGFAPDYEERSDYQLYRRFLRGEQFEPPRRGRPKGTGKAPDQSLTDDPNRIVFISPAAVPSLAPSSPPATPVELPAEASASAPATASTSPFQAVTPSTQGTTHTVMPAAIPASGPAPAAPAPVPPPAPRASRFFEHFGDKPTPTTISK